MGAAIGMLREGLRAGRLGLTGRQPTQGRTGFLFGKRPIGCWLEATDRFQVEEVGASRARYQRFGAVGLGAGAPCRVRRLAQLGRSASAPVDDGAAADPTAAGGRRAFGKRHWQSQIIEPRPSASEDGWVCFG